jgi:hypothetical protein
MAVRARPRNREIRSRHFATGFRPRRRRTCAAHDAASAELSQGTAPRECGAGVHGGTGDRGVRFDPDRQPGDAIVGMAFMVHTHKRLSGPRPELNVLGRMIWTQNESFNFSRIEVKHARFAVINPNDRMKMMLRHQLGFSCKLVGPFPGHQRNVPGKKVSIVALDQHG